MPLIQDRIKRATTADYTQCAEVQAFIQQLVDKDDLVFWATKMEEPVITMALPEKVDRNRFYRFLP